MIGHQVVAKATRDTFFLTNFDVTTLPNMGVVASLVSIVVVLASTRVMQRIGPVRLTSASFVISGVLLMFEWQLARHLPRVAALVFFLHFAAFGAVLISGFWSVVNEHFDPRTARRRVARIGAASAIGGMLGGLMAYWAISHIEVPTLLPALGALHLVCAIAIRFLPPLVSPSADRAAQQHGPPRSGLKVLAEVGYLRGLAILVTIGTIGTALLDYVLKARATAMYTDDESLMRFFILFYTGVSLFSFLVQSLATRSFLERFGLAKAVATVPTALAVGSIGSLFLPGLLPVAAFRAAGTVCRGSLYRTGYELLFTPLSRHDKRATKSLLDVGSVRLGDILGYGLVMALLALGSHAEKAILGAAAVLGAVALFLSLRLQQGYIEALQKSLMARSADLDDVEVTQAVNQRTVLQTLGVEDLDGLRAKLKSAPKPERLNKPADATGVTLDPVVARLAELRSADQDRVVTALKEGPLDRSHVPQTISLLGWDPVARAAARALQRVAAGSAGQLADALLDTDKSFSVRRRIPSVLGSVDGERAIETLFTGLADRRFEVRFRCGRALARALERQPDVQVDPKRVFEIVIREVSVDRKVWESYRLLDRLEDQEEKSSFVDEVLKERTSRGLEHVFTLLSLVLETEPLILAYRGLYTDDQGLRGTSLEYLELVLPSHVRAVLWPFLEERGKRGKSDRTREEIMANLLRSHRSIELNLAAMQEKRRRGGA